MVIVVADYSGPNLKHFAREPTHRHWASDPSPGRNSESFTLLLCWEAWGQAILDLAGQGVEWEAKAILPDGWSQMDKMTSVKQAECLGIMARSQALL